MCTKSDLEKYRRELTDRVKSPEASSLSNRDRAHNAMIEAELLTQCSRVRMYCGEMSVFRGRFYNHIAKSHGNEIADYCRDAMRSAVESFLSRPGTTLDVIVENYRDDLTDDLIFPRQLWRQALSDSKITLRRLDNPSILKGCIAHTASGDGNKILRVEMDKDKHEAICLFNADKKVTRSCNDLLDNLSSKSDLVVSC